MYDYALSSRAFGSGGLRTGCVGRLRHVVVLAKPGKKRGNRIKRATLSASVLDYRVTCVCWRVLSDCEALTMHGKRKKGAAPIKSRAPNYLLIKPPA